LASQPTVSLYRLNREIGRDAVLAGLAATPSRIAELLEGQANELLTRPPSPRSWSAFQVCCHMRDAALIYSARFRWIVFDDNPILPNYDEDNWVASARDTVTDLPAILNEIAASRADLLRVLGRLPEPAWARVARHEVIGPVVLEAYVGHQLAHEEMHLGQLESALRP
jgi:hypothetical protein